ncbi:MULTISPECIES: flagellar filament capping protein FliD [Thermoanaerobacterium]|uniref:Flagellar hook-associated protein 2 n=2 Tax=Thermoanaerobacterium TaxID=28895 RepID=W9ECV1_9THEO|nr:MULTISPECIES: flagellar filament capping protein FliD [Thermoanaerobacterium]AFK87382.1 flagellar hook-associated protein 2 domain-containing protein [Thermoanaerobacterium saccharolyticum JW/SL-YS485]ETO38845.1 flagellar hook-associated protein 2 domain-containing protein [Thermoanaerobacterium aotearoense SCUT27]
MASYIDTSYMYMMYPYYSDYSYFFNTSNPLTSLSNITTDNISQIAQQALYTDMQNQQLPMQTTNALVMLNSYANNLADAASQLQLTSPDNVFNQMVATSSDPNSISVLAQPGATATTYSVTVNQLAMVQQNNGTSLSSNSVTSLTPGTYSFTAQVGGQQYNISFNVNQGDTNQTVLDNMAQAINSANIGITAVVNNNPYLGTSQLEINANNTGTNNAFTLTDVNGNAVSYTGANTVTVEATNANYIINGVSGTSQTNTVNIDNNNLTMTFDKTISNATVTVAPDAQSISDSINNFVNDYNEMLTYANQNQQYISPLVVSELTQSYEYQASNLQAIGITQNPDMTLSIDQNTLNNAIQNNFSTVQAAFAGFDGLAVNVGQFAGQIAESPLTDYANETMPLVNNNMGIYDSTGMLDASLIQTMLMPSGQFINSLI